MPPRLLSSRFIICLLSFALLSKVLVDNSLLVLGRFVTRGPIRRHVETQVLIWPTGSYFCMRSRQDDVQAVVRLANQSVGVTRELRFADDE